METQSGDCQDKTASTVNRAEDRGSERLKAFLSGLQFRIGITFVLAALVLALVADIMHPLLATGSYNRLTEQLAAEIKSGQQQVDSDRILFLLRQHDLAWYYITDASGKVTDQTQPFRPHLPGAPQNTAHEEKWLGKRYFEAVARIDDSRFLHVGYYISPLVLSQLFSPFFTIEPYPLGPMLMIFVGMLVSVLAVSYLAMGRPATQLASALRSMNNGETFEFPDLSAAVSEMRAIAEAAQSLHSKFGDLLSRGAAPGAVSAERNAVGVTTTQGNIAEFYTKDAEEEFINILGRELDALKSSHQLCQRVLDKLNDKFPTSIVYGVMFRADKDQRFSADAFLGFDDRTLQLIRRIDHQRIAGEAFSAGNFVVMNADTMKEHGLQALLAAMPIKSAVFVPLSYQNRNLGMLAVYFRNEGKTVHDRVRFLRTAVSTIAKSLYEVVIYEEELQAALTDPLTGVRNRKFFQELMPKVFARAAAKPNEQPLTLMMIHGDQFKELFDTYGHVVADQMVQALAQAIRQCVRTSDGDGRGTPGDFLVRLGNEEFVLVMESTETTRALGIAERIRNAVSQKTDWPGGIKTWTVSIGAATYPQDARNSDDLIHQANSAVHYVKDELKGNKVCHVKQLPDGYKAKEETAAIGGELGVFDPAALLQSLATNRKTGILTVQGKDAKNLWMLFEGGRPVQAKLGKFAGAAAIVEFVTTFEEGSFNFQEKIFGPKETLTKLPRLDSTYNVDKGLERCLMDGALALDNYNAARALITSPDIIVRPIGAVEFSARWQALAHLPEPPTQEEFSIMSDIVQYADGRTTLTQIFQRMDNIPTARLWRAAGLLVQHGLVMKLSSLPV